MTTYKKGDIVLVPFPFSEDPSKAKKRPALVVQNNRNNERLQTLIIAQITSNVVGVGKEPTQMLIKMHYEGSQETGLLSDSAVKCENLATIAKKRVIKKLGSLPKEQLPALDRCLMASLDLS